MTTKKPKAKSVDEYIAAQPKTVQSTLKKVRAAIRKALPDSEEVISYSIPAYRVNGRVAIFFAAWKEHYSLYPAIGTIKTEFKDELAKYQVTKGTIRFPLSEPVPVGLISRLAKFRAKAIQASFTPTSKAPKAP